MSETFCFVKEKTLENQLINKGFSTQGGNRTRTSEKTGF